MNTDALVSLHTALVDARAGYDTAIEKAETPDIASTLGRMRSLHDDAHADIHRALRAKGVVEDDSGSFMGTVHKTVISVRSALTGIDEDALSSFVSGEKTILERYDEAIQEETDPQVASRLQTHRERLNSGIAEMSASA